MGWLAPRALTYRQNSSVSWWSSPCRYTSRKRSSRLASFSAWGRAEGGGCYYGHQDARGMGWEPPGLGQQS